MPAGAFGASRRSQPYRRGARDPGMALRNMMQGRPGFLPNPMALERETMKRQRGGLGAVLRSLPQRGGGVGPLSTQGAARGGLGQQGAMQMRQARGIGQFRQQGQQLSNMGGIPTRDAYRASHGQNFRQQNPYRNLYDPSDASRTFGPVGPPGGAVDPGFHRMDGMDDRDPIRAREQAQMDYLRRLELARRSAPVPRY